jgi:hypothetical protein
VTGQLQEEEAKDPAALKKRNKRRRLKQAKKNAKLVPVNPPAVLEMR